MNYEIPFIDEKGNALVKSWTKGVQFEEAARQQVFNTASLPFIHKYVAIMPDVHAGFGATVGSVTPTKRAIVPSAVGVDIGCGMMAIQLPLNGNDLPNLHTLRCDIEKAIPHGRTDNGGKNDRGAWNVPPTRATMLWTHTFEREYNSICEKHPKLRHPGVHSQLGTLGTGNHFVEVCLDENSQVWVMLHSGSRGVGNSIGSYFIEKAKLHMERYFINLPDKDLAYLPESTEDFNDYWQALTWAQNYAKANRQIMMRGVLEIFQKHFDEISIFPENYPSAVNCHHNYVSIENHFGANVYVTRKGAVSARLGQMGIIPGSMGTRSYIVRGKGNKESFESCGHGAGRVMSRTQARREFTLEDHIKATEGVECRKDAEVVDETPMAYKSIDSVMEAQKDLVEVVHTLKQVLCVKG